jgi:division protein CdvB (Snf7/Vps24/ESCRT-III family)
LAHGLWTRGTQPKTAEVQTGKFDRPAILNTQLVTLADLDDLSRRLQSAILRLAELNSALSAAIPRA